MIRRPAVALVLTVAAAVAVAAVATLPLLAEGDAPGSLVEAPRPLDPRVGRVGELVPDLELRLADGSARRLSKLSGERGLVIVARSESCPVCRRYGPSLAPLEKDAAALGFAVAYLSVAKGDDAAAATAAVRDHGLGGAYALDPERVAARALGVTSTAECFVLDASRTLRYRGALDDQYGLGYVKAAPGRRYLRDALAAVAAGRRPDTEATSAPGCAVSLPAAPAAPASDGAAPTWHGRVSRIVDRHCVECHREGEAGPFPLVSRDDVLAEEDMVRRVVAERAMPPWFASPEHGDFATDQSLSDRDRADLLAWLDAGGPEGDPADAVRPLARTRGWHVPEPDLVLRGEPFDVPASGVVPYRYQWIEASAEEDRWVRAVEVRPSSPAVVHHVLVFARHRKDDPRAQEQARFDGGLTGYFAATVPGQGWFEYPDGMAKRWPAGTDLYLQVHYTPNGKAVTDRPSVGIVFAKGPPEDEVRTRGIFHVRFEIPPGAPRHEVTSVYTFPEPARVLEFMPHMHLRGTAFRYDLEMPDGAVRTLLDIPRWDFNWQIVYRLREPLEVPRGARLHATGWFDNSAANPGNPDAAATVRFGEQTTDEMMIGYFDWIPAAR